MRTSGTVIELQKMFQSPDLRRAYSHIQSGRCASTATLLSTGTGPPVWIQHELASSPQPDPKSPAVLIRLNQRGSFSSDSFNIRFTAVHFGCGSLGIVSVRFVNFHQRLCKFWLSGVRLSKSPLNFRFTSVRASSDPVGFISALG